MAKPLCSSESSSYSSPVPYVACTLQVLHWYVFGSSGGCICRDVLVVGSSDVQWYTHTMACSLGQAVIGSEMALACSEVKEESQREEKA
ncbi:hypothetical protein Sjap_009148 [Stephania japonica]|uniref:Uncharacterized protein n=1 Tax=Stephania japonica TaxID=461633 RepID=A0AAP0JRE6_9MAGN